MRWMLCAHHRERAGPRPSAHCAVCPARDRPVSAPTELLSTARQWLGAGRRAMEVLVLEARGSVPRGVGTRMLVAADAVVGTIGGGHLELQAIALARKLLAIGAATPHDQHYPLGPALGQCCGGTVTLRTQALSEASLADWRAGPPLFALQLYGAGHVGRAIVRLLEGLNCSVRWIDEREAEFPSTDSALHVERVCVEPVEDEVATAAAGAFYLVLTHRHDLDQRITEAILRRGDFAYLGLIGSATKRARFLRRFEDQGIAADLLARLTCPIGLPGITGKEPEQIAVAVVAQLLQIAARPAV